MSNSDSHGSLVRDEKYDDSDAPQPQRPRSKKVILLGASAALISILALALGLGLGLGLGLTHHHSSPSSSTSSSSSNSSSNPSNLPLLQPTPPENFILGTIKGQPPQTRFYNFTVGEVWGAPDGVGKRMLVVNGMYPGPTIEANQGDRIVVNVTNTLSTRTAIHWHGLFQNGTNFYDGTTGITECGIPPGQFLVYNFTLGEFSGTTWWHSHSTQYTDGLTGALIVHPSTPPPPSLPTWDAELSIQMADLYHNFSGELLDAYLSPFGIDGTPGDEPVPDGGTLNGVGQWGGEGDYFNFTLHPSKTYLLRLSNTGSFASLRFSLDFHPLTVVEVDGTFVEPYTVSGVVVAVAQRYGVLVTTNRTDGEGKYWMRVGVQSDMFTYDQPGQNLDVRAFITYSTTNSTSANGSASTSATNPSTSGLPTQKEDPGPGVQGLGDMDVGMLVPAVVAKAPERTKEYYVSFDLQNDVNGRFLGFVNGTSWTPLAGTSTLLTVRDDFKSSNSSSSNSSSGGMVVPEGGSTQPGDQFMITEDSVQVVDLVIDNLDDGDHPFHLHGHRPWIMGTAAGRYQSQPLNNTNPLRRDTVLIPAYSWMVLRFVVDNPGLWAFHCHLAWHMAAGLLMQINALPSKAALLDVPGVIVDQCKVDVPGE